MKPDRAVAGASDTTSPGEGALQAVLVRLFSPRHTPQCALKPAHRAAAALPALGYSLVTRPPPPDKLAAHAPAFRLSSVRQLPPDRILWHGVPKQGGQG